MVKKLNDSNLLPTFKEHSQFKICGTLSCKNSKYFSNFEVFKSLLPHANGL
jgi:hypothetical protein